MADEQHAAQERGGTRGARRELTEDWLLAQRQPSTTGPYRSAITAFFEWCDRRGVDPLDARRRDIDAYRHHLASPQRPGGTLRAATVYRHLSTISSWYHFGIQDGRLEINPVLAVKRPRVDQESRTEELTLDEAVAMLAASLRADPRTAALLHLLLGTGARVSEICTATTADLGWGKDGERTLRIVRKGGRESRVPVQLVMWAPVQDYLEGRPQGPEGPLLLTERGAMDRRTAWQIVSDLAGEVVRSKRVHPHSFRHAAATIALNLGQPIQEVQEMLGHKSVATTMRYDRARGSRGGQASRAVADAVAAAMVAAVEGSPTA